MDPSASNTPLLEQRDGAIAILTLNRPERRNALSDELIGALTEALDGLTGAPDIRAVILRGKGPAFCAGHDLQEMTAQRAAADRGRAAFAGLFGRCAKMMAGILRHPKPVIAEVHGPATAAGCQLVASCDLAIAAEGAFFATPGVQIGLFCSTPMVALSRNLPRKHAMEMLLTGEAVDADRAAQLGLVNRVVPAARLAEETMALARTIAARSPAAVRFGKPAFYEQLESGVDDAYARTAQIMTENMLAGDACEGIDAFLGKRNAVWPDR